MTILIDKLLQACVKQGASDIHIVVGPAAGVSPARPDAEAGDQGAGAGRHRRPDEEHRARPLPARVAGEGQCRLRLCVRRPGPLPRLDLQAARQHRRWCCGRFPTTCSRWSSWACPTCASSSCSRPRGLFLVTGPTGSGKSTSLASMINYINENVDHHIITIEDPIEFYHYHKKSTINQREIGVDVPSFSEAIRRALRQDPDVILVGEMRDLETIEAAITAAETGHIVFGTLHTNSAQGTVNRIIDVFPTTSRTRFARSFRRRSSASLPRRCCPRSAAAAWPRTKCWSSRSGIANLIRENKTFRITSAIQTGAKFGMQLMDDALFKLWKEEKCTHRRRARQGPQSRRPGQAHPQRPARHHGRRRGRKGDEEPPKTADTNGQAPRTIKTNDEAHDQLISDIEH